MNNKESGKRKRCRMSSEMRDLILCVAYMIFPATLPHLFSVNEVVGVMGFCVFIVLGMKLTLSLV